MGNFQHIQVVVLEYIKDVYSPHVELIMNIIHFSPKLKNVDSNSK